MKSTVVQGNGWHTGAGIDGIRQEELLTEQGEGMGDGRAEELSATVGGGRAAGSLMLMERTVTSLRVCNLRVCV